MNRVAVTVKEMETELSQVNKTNWVIQSRSIFILLYELCKKLVCALVILSVLKIFYPLQTVSKSKCRPQCPGEIIFNSNLFLLFRKLLKLKTKIIILIAEM